jgi:hypothetical protein
VHQVAIPCSVNGGFNKKRMYTFLCPESAEQERGLLRREVEASTGGQRQGWIPGDCKAFERAFSEGVEGPEIIS